MMPSLDGIQTLEMALAMDDNLSKNSPFIALTANAVSGVRDILIAKGFTDYLSKPIDVKLMERMLMNYLPIDKLRSPEIETPTDSPEKISAVNDLINAESAKLDALKAHKKGLMQQLFP